jgi:hypothetical protein
MMVVKHQKVNQQWVMSQPPEPPVEEPPVHHYQHQNQLMMALKLM